MSSFNLEKYGYVLIYKVLSKFQRFFYLIHKYFKAKSEDTKYELYKMDFGNRDTDIFIVTYPKSGTTLTQMILHQLTSSGGADFNHIYDVSPWLSYASTRNTDYSHLPEPRIIKSHDNYHRFCPETKGKFIHIIRNGMDVALSLYHQNKNYNFSELNSDDFFNHFLKERKSNWFNFNKNWLDNEHNFDILYLSYEDLISDKEQVISKIIKHCNLKPTDFQIENALYFSSFEFMKSHENKFGEQPNEDKVVYNQFIREGKVGKGSDLFNDNQKSRYQEMVKILKSNSEFAHYL